MVEITYCQKSLIENLGKLNPACNRPWFSEAVSKAHLRIFYPDNFIRIVSQFIQDLQHFIS